MKGFVFMLVLGLAAASIEDSDKITQINIRRFLEVLRKVPVPKEENEQILTDLMIKLAETENGKKMKNAFNDILDQLTSVESERKVRQREFLDKIMNEVLPNSSTERRTKLLLMIERFLNGDSSSEHDGDDEYKGKVMAFFKDMNLDLQEKQLEFGSQIEKALRGMALSEDKIKNLEAVAVVFSKQSTTISQEILNEAKEFFSGYKDEMKDSRIDFPGNFQIITNNKE